jgi:hypothetical protein
MGEVELSPRFAANFVPFAAELPGTGLETAGRTPSGRLTLRASESYRML